MEALSTGSGLSPEQVQTILDRGHETLSAFGERLVRWKGMDARSIASWGDPEMYLASLSSDLDALIVHPLTSLCENSKGCGVISENVIIALEGVWSAAKATHERSSAPTEKASIGPISARNGDISTFEEKLVKLSRQTANHRARFVCSQTPSCTWIIYAYAAYFTFLLRHLRIRQSSKYLGKYALVLKAFIRV